MWKLDFKSILIVNHFRQEKSKYTHFVNSKIITNKNIKIIKVTENLSYLTIYKYSKNKNEDNFLTERVNIFCYPQEKK